METEIEITGTNKKGWFGKIKDWSYENWQTILVVLIVLIIGMSAYNYNQETDNSSEVAVIEENKSTENTVEKSTDNQEAIVETQDQKIADQEDIAIENNEKEVEVIQEITKEEVIISSSDDSGQKYTITAVAGEGITHLARHALNKYMQETGDGEGLSQEHKIYIEDYLQNRTGDGEIERGHQESFSESLIEEAITNARNLSPVSINNLSKYIKN
ncbi:MAG: hypothetical protein KAS01_02900 [Candidatus Pacebacteria bacterium]|nr:hypothetical protein [Candidatus Paceibacterota bacterium]